MVASRSPLRRLKPMNAITAKPTPSIAQVLGSGTPEVMLWLKPVIEPPAIRRKEASSVMLKGELARKAAKFVPAKLSGSVIGVPNTCSSSVPGVPGAPCPLPASAKNDSDDGSEPTALLKVNEPELRMKVTGLRKPVSPASSVIFGRSARKILDVRA